MASTEFHGSPENVHYRDSGEPYWKPARMRAQHSTLYLSIDVIEYREVAQLTGIAGRAELDADELDELIANLEQARDFLRGEFKMVTTKKAPRRRRAQ